MIIGDMAIGEWQMAMPLLLVLVVWGLIQVIWPVGWRALVREALNSGWVAVGMYVVLTMGLAGASCMI